jgi:hypothetical protein
MFFYHTFLGRRESLDTPFGLDAYRPAGSQPGTRSILASHPELQLSSTEEQWWVLRSEMKYIEKKERIRQRHRIISAVVR